MKRSILKDKILSTWRNSDKKLHGKPEKSMQELADELGISREIVEKEIAEWEAGKSS